MDQPAAADFLDSVTTAFHAGDPDAGNKPAEAANIRHLRELYGTVLRGDFEDAYAAALADDVVLEINGPLELPLSGRWEGPRAVTEATRRNFALFADQQAELTSVIAQGDTVVVLGREQGRYVATGRPYDLTFVQEFTFRDGKVARIREVFDTAALLAAAQPAG